MLWPTLLTPSKINLELLMGREAVSPHLKPLSGLAKICACVSPWALPPQGQVPVSKLANLRIEARKVLPDGPESVLQAVVTPPPVLTQHMLHCYPNIVRSLNSLHTPRTVFNAGGDSERPEGGRLNMSDHNV